MRRDSPERTGRPLFIERSFCFKLPIAMLLLICYNDTRLREDKKMKTDKTTNGKKCKCGWCREEIKKGDGIVMFGHITHKRFFICKKCFLK